MCRFKLFTIVAAALMMAACSSEDITQQPKTGEMQFTATIAAPSNGGTRTAYTVDGTDIKVAWKVGDEIALVHNYVKDVATVKTVNADGSATIEGILTGTTDELNGAGVELIYPSAYISDVDNYGNPTMDEGYYNLLFKQDGTLDYIQNNIDFREGEGQLSVNGTEVTLNAAVDMVSSIAIWKLTLQDNAATPAALAATKVTINSGSDELASTTELNPGASTVYLAVPAATGDITGDICITATTADNDYFYMKEGVALEAKKYYQSTVQMTKGAHLAFLSADYEAKDGAILTGTLASNVKISIANNATVTLKDANINGSGTWTDGSYAGITCAGTATINLEGTNTVKGFINTYPGIYVPENETLTINGPGSLKASTGGTHGSGIGGIHWGSCGNITITGGTITAEGGAAAAAIGSGNGSSCGDITITGGNVTAIGNINDNYRGVGIGCGDGYSADTNRAKCGNITISGGTVTATGKNGGVGIGSGLYGDCGTITITSGVTSVTATKGSGATNSIGAGDGGTCGTVTIGCTLTSDGNPVGGTTGVISTSPYTYDPSNVSPLANVTSADLGKVVCAAGHLHLAKTAVPSGCTAVGILGKVTETGHGLILALQDAATQQTWRTINGWTSVDTYAGTTLKQLPDNTARSPLTSYTTLGSITVSNWCVAQKSDYEAIFINLGSTTGDTNGTTYDDNVNAYITTGVGGTAISVACWSATESVGGSKSWIFGSLGWNSGSAQGTPRNLRPVLGF